MLVSKLRRLHLGERGCAGSANFRVGPLSLVAKFCFLISSFQLWIVAIASASESHDEMY